MKLNPVATLSVVPALLVVVSGCSLDDRDWLISEAASPDGKQVARLWCPDLCDVTGNVMVTVSPASRDVGIEQSMVSGFPPEGQIPDKDIVMSFQSGGAPVLTWKGARAVEIALSCPGDVMRRADHVAITLRATGPCATNDAAANLTATSTDRS